MLLSLYTFKLNYINTVKEGIHELRNRNMVKISITNVIVLTQFTFKLNYIHTVKKASMNHGTEIR